ncbi:MAG: glycosyltransferase 87 family protein [Candidatus Bathyarchaeia archaeon]
MEDPPTASGPSGSRPSSLGPASSPRGSASNPGPAAPQPEPQARPVPRGRGFRISVALVTAASILVHLSAFYAAESSFDLETWRIAAGSFLEDGDFYRAAYQAQRILERQYFVYPPLWGLTLYPFHPLVDSELLFNFTVRILLMLFNLAVGFQLLRSFRAGLGAFTLWMLNPFTIGIAQAGNFDILPAYLSLLSYRWLKPGTYDRSALALGLGIGYKLYPAMFLPLLLRGVPGPKARLRYMALASSIPCLSSLAYLAYSPFFIPSFTEGNAGRISAPSTYIYMGLFMIVLLYAWFRRVGILESILLALLPFYLVIPAYNQYYIWMLPLLLAWLSRSGNILDAGAALTLLSALTLRRYLNYLTGKLMTLQPYATVFNTVVAILIYASIALILIRVLSTEISEVKGSWENLL